VTNSYEFGERLMMSQGEAVNDDIAELLVSQMPGATSAERSDLKNDRQGVDWWINRASGFRLGVDVKVREKDFSQGDVALETWSVVEAGKVGWSRDPKKRTDYILWWWIDTRRWCLVPFPLLCAVFTRLWEDWCSKYKVAQQCTPGRRTYHSECVFVPLRVVWAAIYQQCSGSQILETTGRLDVPAEAEAIIEVVTLGQTAFNFEGSMP